MQHIKQQSKFNSWLLGFISRLDFFLPELIVNALNYHYFGKVHENLWKEKICKKVQLDLQFFYFHLPIPSSWELVKSYCMKPGDGFQIKTPLLFSLVCSWESLDIWCIYLPCIRLYLCSKLVLSLITAGSSTHRSVIFISSSKEWSSLNWEGKHTEKSNGSSNDYLSMHSTTATSLHLTNFSLFQAR